ncbi:MAG: helix-turn-helix domain-containing protein [Deltaproteobacteria bacterium]|nr:helix-turn-helix domain-containing protein [Deltaproteobacteria bacterium]
MPVNLETPIQETPTKIDQSPEAESQENTTQANQPPEPEKKPRRKPLRPQDKLRIRTIAAAAKKTITQKEAAETLNRTVRQIHRLISIYKADGPEALIHKGRGNPSNHRLDDNLRAEVLKLISENYMDLGPTAISKVLLEAHGYVFSAETLRRWMINEKIWRVSRGGKRTRRKPIDETKPKKPKRTKPRKRRGPRYRKKIKLEALPPSEE